MSRDLLRAAREAADLSQEELADLIGAEHKAVSAWETGAAKPQPGLRRRVRDALHNDDPDLFKNFESDTEQPNDAGEESQPSHVEDAGETVPSPGPSPLVIPQSNKEVQVPQPCHMQVNRGILDSSDPAPFVIHIPGSVRGLRELMEMFRRQFVEFVAKLGGASLFGNISLALVSSPTVDPEEYLAQANVSIDLAWDAFKHGDFSKVERVVNTNLPTLTKFAHTLAPYQGIAANLAMQVKVMQMLLATRNRDFIAREVYCIEAVKFGELSGDRNLHILALDWHGSTYTVCYRRPQRAIAIFSEMLPCLNSDTSQLTQSAIYGNLSVAHAQNGNENQARDYMEMAHTAMPKYPELDPIYQCAQWNHQALNALVGKAYLHLAEHLPNSDYAQLAHDALEKSTNLQAVSRDSLVGFLVKKADAARAIGAMDHFVDCLRDGLVTALEINSKRRVSEAHDVMNRIPDDWQHETSVQNLQKDISQALIVARR
jgi:transcriptional regulator with XRE-family HTH domain